MRIVKEPEKKVTRIYSPRVTCLCSESDSEFNHEVTRHFTLEGLPSLRLKCLLVLCNDGIKSDQIVSESSWTSVVVEKL
jgi:hypothetical protein